MTSFHLHVSGILGRGPKAEKTAIAEAAYMDRAQWRDQQTGHLTVNNGKDAKGLDATGDVLFTGIFRDQAWELTKDHQAFWNYVSSLSKRKDAREAQGMIADFPEGLTQQQREYALKDFIRLNFTRKGFSVHAVIHKPSPGGDSRNHHTHLLWTLYEIGPEGRGIKLPEMTPQRLRALRGSWAQVCARQLQRNGKHLQAARHRSAHKTLVHQRYDATRRNDFEHADFCDREPTRHEGPGATAKRRRGESTPISAYNDAVRQRNHARMLARRRARKDRLGPIGESLRSVADPKPRTEIPRQAPNKRKTLDLSDRKPDRDR